MIFELPIQPTSTDFTQVSSLDGSTYEFTFSWSPRSESWYMDLYRLNEDGAPSPVVTGARLSPGYPLLMAIVSDVRPPGEIFLLDLNGQGDPTLEDLGSRCKLYYFDEGSLGG